MRAVVAVEYCVRLAVVDVVDVMLIEGADNPIFTKAEMDWSFSARAEGVPRKAVGGWITTALLVYKVGVVM